MINELSKARFMISAFLQLVQKKELYENSRQRNSARVYYGTRSSFSGIGAKEMHAL